MVDKLLVCQHYRTMTVLIFLVSAIKKIVRNNARSVPKKRPKVLSQVYCLKQDSENFLRLSNQFFYTYKSGSLNVLMRPG